MTINVFLGQSIRVSLHRALCAQDGIALRIDRKDLQQFDVWYT